MNFVRTLLAWLLGAGFVLWLCAKVILDAIGRRTTADDFLYLNAYVARMVVWVFNAAPWWVPAALASALALTAMVRRAFRGRGDAEAPPPTTLAPASVEPTQAPEQHEDEHVVPIHQAIDHIARCTDDSVTLDCYAATRAALRQRAIEGTIRIRGRKQLDDPTKPTFSDVETDIPQDYWTISSIGPMAVDGDFADNGHTFPEPIDAWGSKGLFAKKAYSRLRVDWDDVVRIWPVAA